MGKPRRVANEIRLNGGDLDQALRLLKNLTAPTLASLKRKEHFKPKPSRSARKRRGRAIERWKAKQPKQDTDLAGFVVARVAT